ncbi:MAG: serine/threonine-protein kinase PknK [Persicimonas sp.]
MAHLVRMSNYEDGSTVAGRFVVLEKIGAGGMGAVYRALQTSLDREVALKVLHSDKAFTARARRRFGREARAIARLNHPHIAGVFDFGTDNDDQTLWLAMELVDGFGMSRLKRDDVDVLRLASLTDQVLSALSAAHARGIIHRDLKPSNILVSRDDEGREIIKLVDFGLAATQSGDLDLKNAPGGLGNEKSEVQKRRVILGTPRYMAPEIFRRKPVDPRVDLYALGVILFEILAGTPPYPGDEPKKVMKAHLNAPIPQLEVRGGRDVPAELERSIYRLLAKDPSERIQSAAEARESIQTVINQFSYVPWMVTGPQVSNPNSMSHPGNISTGGFLSGYGGQTVPPSAMLGGRSGYGMVSGQKAPLVGRVEERRDIERRVRRAVDRGEGGLIFLEGDAGTGKSRLLEWIRVRVEESGLMRVAQGIFQRSSGGFNGVRAVLEAVLGTRDASYEQLPYVVRTRLEQWGFSEAEIELTVRLMQPGGEDAVFEPSDFDGTRATARRERVFATLENILKRAAGERPILVILEDLHHSGEPTSAFLEHLSLGLQFDPASLVVVGTVRTGELRNAPHLAEVLDRLAKVGSEDVQRLVLDRLGDAEIVSLIESLAPVEMGVAEEIARRVSGNPLHASELLRYLQESGKLLYDNGSWKLAAGTDIDAEIPGEIADMMRYRARQVWEGYSDAEAMKAILERAAILGRRFDYRLFRSMITREAKDTAAGASERASYADELDAALEILVRDGILREVGHSGEDILEFDHVLMREVLLQDMHGRRELRVVHKLAAEAKIAFYDDRIDARAEEIAEHYRRARHPQGVYIYTLKAARAAANSSDLKRAMQLYREAGQLSESAQAGKAEGTLAEASYVLQSEEVALEVAHLERRVGEYDSARSHYRKLLSGDNLAVSLWARWGLGKLAERQGDLSEAEGWYEAARREARSARDIGYAEVADHVDAFSLCALGAIASMRGNYSAAGVLLGEALEKAEQVEEASLQAEALQQLAEVRARRGDLDNAELYSRRAAILVESIGDAELTARIQMHAGVLLAEAGESQRGLSMLQEALATIEELGEKHLRAECQMRLGQLYWRRGDFKHAARSLRRAHKAFASFDDRRGITRCKYHLARLALNIGRHKETMSLGRDALDGFRDLEDRRGIAACRLLLSRLQFELGKEEAALKFAERAEIDYESIGDVQGKLAARALQALLFERAEDHARVDALLETIIGSEAVERTSSEGVAAAFDELSQLLNKRDPALAIDIDEIAEAAYGRLGRPASARRRSGQSAAT